MTQYRVPEFIGVLGHSEAFNGTVDIIIDARAAWRAEFLTITT